jgi:hypothetical protein
MLRNCNAIYYCHDHAKDTGGLSPGSLMVNTTFGVPVGLEMEPIGRSWVGEAVTAAALVLLFVTILARLGG